MPKSVDTNVQVLPSGLAVSTGVQLPVSVAPASPDYGAVEWLDLGQGNYLASKIWADRLSDNFKRAFWEVFTPGFPSGYAHLLLEAGANTSPRHGAYAEVADETSGFTRSRKVLDSVGGSDFLVQSRIKFAVQAGPWNGAPFNFTIDGGDAVKVLIVYGGSGWCGAAGGNSTLDMYVDGAIQGQVPFFFNVANVHTFMGIGMFSPTLAAGGHSVSLKNGTPLGFPLQSDGNDRGFFFIIPVS